MPITDNLMFVMFTCGYVFH